MDLYVELETLQLIRATNDRRELNLVQAKRGDALPLTIRFIQNGVPTRLDATTTIRFAIKESGKYDDDPLVLEETFTASSVTSPDSDPRYTSTPSLNTTALNTLFLIDSDASNDLASIDLMAEITWEATGDTGPTSCKTFTFRCANDVYRGTENTPTAEATPSDWLNTQNTNRGIQPIRSGATDLFPANMTISGEIIGDGAAAIAIEDIPKTSVTNGFPVYEVTTTESVIMLLDYDSVGKVWELVVNFPGATPTATYQSAQTSKTDPVGLVLSASSRSDITLAASSGILAPQLGDRGTITNEERFYDWDGNTWQPVSGKLYAVADLPAAADSEGRRLTVNDSNVAASGNFAAVVAEGGSNTVPVFSDGTNWIIA